MQTVYKQSLYSSLLFEFPSSLYRDSLIISININPWKLYTIHLDFLIFLKAIKLRSILIFIVKKKKPGIGRGGKPWGA